MKNIFKSISALLLVIFISKATRAQEYDFYRSVDAVMVKVNGNSNIESELKKVLIVLPNYSNQLNVRINIPYYSIDYIPDDTALLNTGLLFDLTMEVNPWKLQDDLIPTKSFTTDGFVTMNNVTKTVRIEYIPLPADSGQDGEFNLSLIIQFNAADFNLDTIPSNSYFIIKINDATVNRV